MKFNVAAFIVGFVLCATFARAQSKVDQGAPGTQGAWPVTVSAPIFIVDGGSINGGSIATFPYHCANTSPTTKIACDGGVQIIGGAVARLYTVVTNAGDDLGAGSGFVKCRPDGVPSLTAGTPGQGGTPGWSVNYTNSQGAPIRCICNSGYVGGFECAP